MRRSLRAALAAVLLLAIGLPTQAQEATSNVSFDGIGFSFDHSLGRSVNIVRVPGQRPGRLQIGEPSPAHIVFSLYQRQGEAKRAPRIWDTPGAVRVYDTSALDKYEQATRQLTELQRLLHERPDPATLEAVSANGPVVMPYLPVEGEAALALVARATYVDTPELSGIAYIAGFRQDTFPFARGDFWYVFQGLSADGRWYVAVSWSLRAGMFPRKVSQADARRVASGAGRWEGYVRRSVAALDAGKQTDFRPSLEALDALVRSFDFDSVVPPSPSPTLPAPTLAPTPTGSSAPGDAVATSAAPGAPGSSTVP